MNVYYLHESCQMSSNTCCTWTTQCTCKRRKWHFGSKIVQKSKKILGLNCELIAVRLPVLRDNIKEPSPGGWQKKSSASKREKSKERQSHSESPYCNRHHLPRRPLIPRMVSHSSSSSLIPTNPQVSIPFNPLPNNPSPRVPTGTHQSFQKEIMAELLRHALPAKIWNN